VAAQEQPVVGVLVALGDLADLVAALQAELDLLGDRSRSRTTAATSSLNMVPRTWARYRATRYMAASWVAKVLVAATQTSGPARV
jgi:hypothetical protein